jgi:hypothetical protein
MALIYFGAVMRRLPEIRVAPTPIRRLPTPLPSFASGRTTISGVFLIRVPLPSFERLAGLPFLTGSRGAEYSRNFESHLGTQHAFS